MQDELDNVLVLHASSGVQAAKSSVARQKQPEPVQPILAEFSKPANQVEMQNAMHRQKKWQLLLSRKTYPDISEKWFPCRDGKRRA